jgi:uncharacterized protein (UPF0218 family)
VVRAVATLPPDARAAFKEPLGPVYEDAQRLLADAGTPIVAVGDVVTYHLTAANAPPKVAVVDGKTEREAVTHEIAGGMPTLDREVDVESEPATISEELLEALVEAIDAEGSTLIRVVGEEDLATLPAVLAAPLDASVVYGQPGEGMVLANVTSALQEQARDLCELLETTESFWTRLE